MSKYHALTKHLSTQPAKTVAMSFAALESVLGFKLPPSARRHRPWWANSGHVQARGWLDAGYHAEQVDLEAERLVFVRLNQSLLPDAPRQDTPRQGGHPLVGCMAGTIALPPGVDLTEPAYSDAEMEAFLHRKTLLLQVLTP